VNLVKIAPPHLARTTFFLSYVLAVGVAVTGCHSNLAASPSIEFTHIPPAGEGGREKVDSISGRVRNARPDQHIVVYAHAGSWWVQPSPEHPLIAIKADSTWSSETHLGFEYAALVVDANYSPPAVTDITPIQGGPIALVTIVKGAGTLQLNPTASLKFSGYDWRVRMIESVKGGLNNLYAPENASTDSSGALHMQIKKKSDRWSCAEIFLDRSLGYGTYSVTVRAPADLEPTAVFSMFTFDEWATEQHFREMGVEVGGKQGAGNGNARYEIQPLYIPGNLFAFATPAGILTYVLRWEAGHATFKTFLEKSAGPRAKLVSEHEFTSGVPESGKEILRLIFFAAASEKNPLQNASEVVVEKFEYLP
jgi:hypothetical protein